ncbi:GNAT family N-acetyltransferase [Bacillus sp. FJAT-45037]|uniref:GNAT family N-acetyltransferase n=1 Tax=Bacillus sp. FJAT-45037 TaxID=2011007 RepID=UPI000C2387B5|nr:GNAT family N-acetyltransferase [Bacillus sp. FJAT-45037]
MIKQLKITDQKVAREVLHVQTPAYKEEARIIEYLDIPPLNDTVSDLQQSDETYYGYYIKEKLCGVISIKITNDILNIHRLVVHPEHFRKGISKQLLHHIEEDREGIQEINVSTGKKNIPAIKLYEQSGFKYVGEEHVNERLSLALFAKKAQN